MTTALPSPSRLSLSELINRLEDEPANKRIAVGFHQPCSYRGYYEDLAFVVTGPASIADMLAAARSALGTTYEGWKGGDYQMDGGTEVWLVMEPGRTGESLGAMFLELLLANKVTT